MKIDIICNDGSPLGVVYDDIWGKRNRIGVGGAESKLLEMCKAWNDMGHSLVLYNDPSCYDGSPFPQEHLKHFNPQADRDILIIFRSPNARSINAKGKKVWWSCDQRTVGDFRQFGNTVDKIVTISPYHADYFRVIYGLKNTISIDLPIIASDYDDAPAVEKRKNSLLFASIPDRGLTVLAEILPMVKGKAEFSVDVTSGYSLWTGGMGGQEDINNNATRLKFARMPNVTFHGAVKREELIRLQKSSEILAYPCTYEELFCITVAEAQFAGLYPMTSDYGALSTTNMGYVQPGLVTDGLWKEQYAHALADLLNDPDRLHKLQDEVKEKARERFGIMRILKRWETEVFNG